MRLRWIGAALQWAFIVGMLLFTVWTAVVVVHVIGGQAYSS
jgi:hypothetical protein